MTKKKKLQFPTAYTILFIVAVMVAVPSPMAVTIPSGATVATASSEDVHVASFIGQCCAAWLISRTVSPNCMLPPTVMIRGV